MKQRSDRGQRALSLILRCFSSEVVNLLNSLVFRLYILRLKPCLDTTYMVRTEAVNFLNLRTFLHNILWS